MLHCRWCSHASLTSPTELGRPPRYFIPPALPLRSLPSQVSDFGLSMQLTTPDQVTKAAAYGTITHMVGGGRALCTATGKGVYGVRHHHTRSE